MGLAQEMEKLGNNIIDSFNSRLNFLGQNIAETHKLKHDARKTIGKFHRDRMAMGRKLHADLGGFTDNLTESVNGLKRRFHKQQNEFHRECASAHQNFTRVGKILASRRHNFKGEIKKATQKASTHH